MVPPAQAASGRRSNDINQAITNLRSMTQLKNAPMIKAAGLTKVVPNGASQLVILHEIDLAVMAGEAVAIVGASGSGKSTLLGLLAGLDTPSAGSVHLNGVAISYLPENKLAQMRGRT